MKSKPQQSYCIISFENAYTCTVTRKCLSVYSIIPPLVDVHVKILYICLIKQYFTD